MGLFSIIETFFFVSLGITILLVALLVYHFKQRVSSIEQKYESLFDIVTGVVKQLSNMQQPVTISHPPQNMGQFIRSNQSSQNSGLSHNFMSNVNEEIQTQWVGPEHLGNMNISNEYQQIFHDMNDQLQYNKLLDNKNIHNNANNEYEEDDPESEEDENETDSDIDESDSDDDDDESDSDDDENDSGDDTKIVVSDDEIANENRVKIINLNVGETINTIEIDLSSHNNEISPINLDYSPETDDIYELPVQDIQIDYSLVSTEEEPPIVVRKIETTVNEPVDTNVVEKSASKDLYKKMTLSNLKATVISKGLCSDPSKMKKTELLKLLEDE